MLVPPEFVVPAGLVTDEFRLRMLTINDVVKDYEAVMTSRDHLRGVFGPQSPWPAADLSLEQDLIDLGWHQKEFQNRTSFAYTVASLGETRTLGCVYIYPAVPANYDAQVILWVRQSELASGLEDRLLAAVKTWIAEDWPFKQVGFPGKEISWAEWQTMQ
ncbi:GNAT family N-acetyltransferase [Leptolyngbya sp. BC1307]|uniref:GNAT family N-acetyltransferase n=1 Tax=Leptolyngbya sp. BC1307 TaxID=2029589 RepID=UPI000EFC13A7|nr:GNAT family N-acetyltransferase [Leptolyngbya sp. BC1307]